MEKLAGIWKRPVYKNNFSVGRKFPENSRMVVRIHTNSVLNIRERKFWKNLFLVFGRAGETPGVEKPFNYK